ncbi:MAG: Nif3-like dinuclear metal center hexameric protein [Labilithrix sp.]|nr:Nif3-like dinuclear metal center hexameric protein [Labilithrix sp.]MCW5832757.1 Nif3-like dinuclear metal center hexameric protein [Labilithrix sp.]
MSMKLTDVLRTLDELAPLRYAESWDNVGLLVGDPEATVGRVLVTVDYSSLVAEEARALGAELVVAYHPPMFAPVKRVPHEALWADAIRRGIALYSPHTALDVAVGGTNDFLADACGVEKGRRRPLRAFAAKPGAPEPDGIGLGRVGAIEPSPLQDVVTRLKPALGLEYVLVAGSLDKVVSRVAVAAGAGGELLGEAAREGADLFVTGEIRHHDALSAVRRGVAVVATLHSNSERQAVRAFASRLAPRLAPIEVVASERDADPFVVA